MMSITRGKKATLNIVFSLLCQVCTLFCGIVVPRLLINKFGSEAYGATTSIAQFLSYITLLEAGIGGVARAALYKPLAEKDNKTISIVMAEIQHFFRIVGLVFIVYVIVIACSFKSISRIECYDWITTFILVVAISISTFAQYFFGITYSVLLQAAQKTYLTKIMNMALTILNTVAIVVLAHVGSSLVEIKLVSSLVFVLRPVVMWLYVKKNYSLYSLKYRKTNYIKQKWTALGQHLAYFLHSHTDVAVLTIFVNLKIVAVYSVYHMIISELQNFASSFATGMEALFGDVYVKGEKELLNRFFNIYDALISSVAVLLFSVASALIIPFIKIYSSGIEDVNYIYPMFGVLLTLASFFYCLRLPYHHMIMAAGHFKETKAGAYGEAAINIILSIILVSQFSLIGVAIGTVVAVLFRLVYYVRYLSKNIINRPIKLFFKRLFVSGGSYALSALIGYSVSMRFPNYDYIGWLFTACIVTLISSFIVLLSLYVFYKDELFQIIYRIKHKKSK